MRKPLLLLFACGLLATGLACSSSSYSSSSGGGYTPPPPAGTDFTAFVKQQVVTMPDNTEPVDVSQTAFTGQGDMNPDTYDDVLGISSATIKKNWSTVR